MDAWRSVARAFGTVPLAAVAALTGCGTEIGAAPDVPADAAAQAGADANSAADAHAEADAERPPDGGGDVAPAPLCSELPQLAAEPELGGELEPPLEALERNVST